MSHDATRRTGQRGIEGSGARPSDPVIGKQTRVEALEIGASPTSAPVQRATAGSDAAPDQIREAAAIGTRGAGGSLPHVGEIQRLFGRHDVRGVVAHTDADAARGAGAMGAQAFATGGHVAFDGQPSLHTAAHEAAHVVQQRGGVQLYGGIGTTGDAHEQHADAVADRVVAGESAEPLLDGYAGAGSAAGPAVAAVQRMVTQIVPRPERADVIQRVVVVGRPERSHGASMGDHSTAFTLHVEGIRSQLQGKTLTDAVGELDALVRAAHGLPGFAMIAELPDEKRVNVEDKWTAQLRVRNRPALADPGSADAAALALDLQDYINAYLEFREVIPMSTINVAAKSPATAGKGKGESADALVRRANGEAVPPHELLAAIAKLFDARGAALVAAEPLRDMLAELAPGLDPGLDYQTRMTRMVDQHVGSVAASFPSVFAADGGVTPEAVRATLEIQILPLVLESWNADLRAWQRRVDGLSDQARKSRENAAVEGGRKAQAAARATAERLEAEARDWRDEIARTRAQATELDGLLSALLGAAQRRGGLVAPTAPADSHAMDVDDGAAPSSSTPHAATADRGAMDLDDGAPGPSTPGAASPSAAPQATDGGAAADQGSEPDDERKQPLATQLKLASNGTIAEVISAGRSPSPFSGTMGAHTTSWVVHLDRIRRAVTGKTVADAVVALGPVLGEADQMRAKLTGVFPIRGDHQRLLDAARVAAVDALVRGQSATPQTRPALLQQAINELLTYINYVPGATLEAADTGGKVEGMHRGTLRAAENGAPIPPGELRVAILGLLDIKAATEPDQREALVENHLDLIGATYPTALALAIRSEVEDMALDHLDHRDDGDGDTRSDGSTARRPNAKRGRNAAGQAKAKRRRGGDPDATTSLPGSSTAAPPPPPMAFDFTAFGAIDESMG